MLQSGLVDPDIGLDEGRGVESGLDGMGVEWIGGAGRGLIHSFIYLLLQSRDKHEHASELSR